MTVKLAPSDRTANCGCGELTVNVSAEPLTVFACSCLNCQREGGGAFTYNAIYPQAGVSISGERKAWRRAGDSGSWVETQFCPICGGTVFYRMEAWPDVIGILAGCFADPEFPKPETLYWPHRRHTWLEFPKDVKLAEEMPD